MTNYRSDILSLDEMHASIQSGEKYQTFNGEVMLELVERVMDLEATLSKLTEIMLPRNRP